MTVSFYGTGGETTGSVAERRIDTAKNETTGSIGVRNNKETIFAGENDLKQDTVCFRGQNEQKKTSPLAVAFWTTVGVGTLVGLAGLAHKYNKAGKITNENAQKFLKNIDAVTEPCYRACSWVKQNCYDKVVKMFSKGK